MARRVRGPTLAYITHRVDEAEARDSDRNKHWDEVERLLHRQHEVPVPERFKALGFRTVKVPLLNEVRRIVLSALAQATMSVSVPPRALSEEAQANSSKREKWLMSVLSTLDGSDGQHRAYTDGADHAVTFGLSVPKLLYLPDAWDAEQFKRREEDDLEYNKRTEAYKRSAPLPFVWLTPDPRTFHPWYQYRRLVEVVEVSERPRYDLAERYKDLGVRYDEQTGRLRSRYGEAVAKSALGIDSLKEKIQFVEHWDDEHVTYVADGVILHQMRHDYKRLPYFPFFGLSTASRVPQYEAQGVMDDALDLVPAIDSLLTMWLNWGYLAAYPMGVYRRSATAQSQLTDAGTGQPLDVIDWVPLAYKVLEPGAAIEWIVAPQIGADLQKMSDMLLQLFDRAAAVPDILRGEAKSGTPAWGMSQLLMTARRVFDPITDNYAVALTEMCKFLLQLVERRVGTTVYAMVDDEARVRDERKGRVRKRGYLGLGPEDVDGYHAVSVELATLTQDKRIQEGIFGAQIYQGGAIPMREWVEHYLHYSAPEEMLKERLVEDYRRGTAYQAMIERVLARRFGLVEAQAMGATPQEQAALMGQAGGVPPGPAGPAGTAAIPGAPSPQPPLPGQGLPLAQPPPMGAEGGIVT